MPSAALNDIRAKQLFDELDLAAPLPAGNTIGENNAQVLGNTFNKTRLPFYGGVLYKDGPNYRITPAYFENIPVPGTEAPFLIHSSVDPSGNLQPVAVWIRLGMFWGYRPSETPGLYVKSGFYRGLTARMLLLLGDEQPPDDQLTPVSTTDLAVTGREHVLHYRSGTVLADGTIDEGFGWISNMRRPCNAYEVG